MPRPRRRRMPPTQDVSTVMHSPHNVISRQPIVVHGVTEVRRGASHVDVHGVSHEPVELVVRTEGARGGEERGPMPRHPEPIDPHELTRILQQHAQMVADLERRAGEMMGGGERHGGFIQGLKPSRREIPGSFWGGLFPSGIIHFWNIHPLAAIGAAFDRTRHSRYGNAPTKLKATGGKEIFTSRKAEQAREGRLLPIRAEAAPQLNAALEQWRTAASGAIAELQRNPTKDQRVKYERDVAIANETLRLKEGAILTAFSKKTSKFAGSDRGQSPKMMHRL